MDNLQKSVAFRKMLCEDIVKMMRENGYKLVSDINREDKSSSDNNIFRLKFTGGKQIEIYNEDWRDYLEYFNVSVNGAELFHINIDDYPDLGAALAELNRKIIEVL